MGSSSCPARVSSAATTEASRRLPDRSNLAAVRLRWGRLGLVCALMLLAGAAPARAGLLEHLLKPERPSHDPTYQNPVLTGDYPDPSVIQAPGGGWLAAVTSGGRLPACSI